jgi:hypothetical protein
VLQTCTCTHLEDETTKLFVTASHRNCTHDASKACSRSTSWFCLHCCCRHQPVGSASRVKVAVKRLKPELYNAADLQLFAKEVELMRKLSHRYIGINWPKTQCTVHVCHPLATLAISRAHMLVCCCVRHSCRCCCCHCCFCCCCRNIVDMVGVVDGCSCSIVQVGCLAVPGRCRHAMPWWLRSCLHVKSLAVCPAVFCGGSFALSWLHLMLVVHCCQNCTCTAAIAITAQCIAHVLPLDL